MVSTTTMTSWKSLPFVRCSETPPTSDQSQVSPGGIHTLTHMTELLPMMKFPTTELAVRFFSRDKVKLRQGSSDLPVSCKKTPKRTIWIIIVPSDDQIVLQVSTIVHQHLPNAKEEGEHLVASLLSESKMIFIYPHDLRKQTFHNYSIKK